MSIPSRLSVTASAEAYCGDGEERSIFASARAYLPGLALVGLTGLAATSLASDLNVSATLMALLVGLSISFLGSDPRVQAGLGLASRGLLRLGIVLLGARITVSQMVHLGPTAVAAIALILGLTMLVGLLAARQLGCSASIGILAGGSVAICGASAAMALAEALGERRVSQGHLTIVLAGVSVFSALAMSCYPIVLHQMHAGDTKAGFVLGAAIHDVAQSIGAGYSFSALSGETAAIVKLTRVAMLPPVLMIIGCFLPGGDGSRSIKGGLPWYVSGFIILAVCNSAGLISKAMGQSAAGLSGCLLMLAIAATGIKANGSALLRGGSRILVVIGVSSGASLAMALLAARMLFP